MRESGWVGDKHTYLYKHLPSQPKDQAKVSRVADLNVCLRLEASLYWHLVRDQRGPQPSYSAWDNPHKTKLSGQNISSTKTKKSCSRMESLLITSFPTSCCHLFSPIIAGLLLRVPIFTLTPYNLFTIAAERPAKNYYLTYL